MFDKQQDENREIPKSNSRLPYSELFRPQFHFSPEEKWMNDPNGMVYYEGEYHLFYQHYPDDTVWGPMHWGHAISTDLVNWQHLPIALFPDELGYIFSGSAVIDWHNTAGFGKEAMIAIFTHHNEKTLDQSQSIAYSLDKGRSWEKFAGNPVIPTPANIRDFRDPKVFWYESGIGEGHWVMSLAAGSAILFYTSSDLKSWETSGAFGFGWGSTEGVWETPDLFELPVDNGPETRWVLTVGVGDGAPAGGSGMQYFIGEFDGKTFSSENPKDSVLWGDYGADFYAAQSWSDSPDGRRVWLAWLNNWRYANQVPTDAWRGAMSIPRQVGLTQTGNGIKLTQLPIPELSQLRQHSESWQNIILADNQTFTPPANGELFEIIVDFAFDPAVNKLGINLDYGNGQITNINYGPKANTFVVDRSASGTSEFYDGFATYHAAPLAGSANSLSLHIFVDRGAIEIFNGDGTVTFAELIFPDSREPQLVFFAEAGEAIIKNLEIHSLTSAGFYRSE